jgi:hypothetical protein
MEVGDFSGKMRKLSLLDIFPSSLFSRSLDILDGDVLQIGVRVSHAMLQLPEAAEVVVQAERTPNSEGQMGGGNKKDVRVVEIKLQIGSGPAHLSSRFKGKGRASLYQPSSLTSKIKKLTTSK